jgi:hypothetical protein
VLTLKDIKAHYDAIGSNLHMPSLQQLEAGKIADPAKLRTRCGAVVAALESVLGSPVYNVTLGNFAQLAECMNDACRRPVRKRIPHGRPKSRPNASSPRPSTRSSRAPAARSSSNRR